MFTRLLVLEDDGQREKRKEAGRAKSQNLLSRATILKREKEKRKQVERREKKGKENKTKGEREYIYVRTRERERILI